MHLAGLVFPMLVACGAAEFLPVSPATGPLVDAACSTETVEQANADGGLHAVLDDLLKTSFFRLIRVRMDGTCQYFEAEEAEADCGNTF